MTKNLQRWILIGGAATLLLLPLFFYAIDNIRSGGEVARNVSAAGVELGGLGEEDAIAAIREYEAQLASAPATFVVNGQDFDLDPHDVGIDIDEQRIVDQAMEQRREQGFLGGFFPWFGSFGDQIELDVPVTLDAELLDGVLREWEAIAIDLPAYEGGVIVRDTRVLPDYPRPGEGIDRDDAQRVVLQALQTIERESVVLETKLIDPVLTDADIDAATLAATRLIDAPVTLSAAEPELNVVFTREQLAEALLTDVRSQSPPEITFGFDPDRIRSILLPLRGEIEQPPLDAEWIIDEETKEVTLQPSRPATLLDADLVSAALLDAAATTGNAGDFPFGEGTKPAFTTEDAQAMGDIKFVSEFTTAHPAGQQRVINIHLMADAIDGAIVEPGDEFSINEHVGQRTTTKGYVPATMILAGELVDDVGGGVSQFATTFYNAVFYGCYEDIDHKPHSYYFSRYPEVNEATISWPSPNLIFRNNTDTVVIIKTKYTETELTVQFYGDNGGCVAERVLGDRFAFTTPEEQYEADPALNPDEQKVVQNGWGGFSNSVTRIMTWPDGTVVEEPYVWKYNAAPKIIRVHPCNVPADQADGEPPECPVQVPGLGGWSVADARAAVESIGLTLVEGETVEVADEGQNGLIQSQSTAGGEWLDLGSAITVTVGVYVPPEEPPPEG
jgi:vancomycin resistance protein YoaR